jgi:predicted RNA-binding Zn ribbon-like protein
MAATLDVVTPPPWAAHVEDKQAPMPLLLVQAFVDTLEADTGTDLLAHADEAEAWLAAAGLRDAGGAPGAGLGGDLTLARRARESMRALIGRNTGGRPLTDDETGPLRTVLREAAPCLDLTADGRVLLEAGGRPGSLAHGLLRLLLIIRDAQADGTWDRLKLCGNPDCRWAFYDRSHSRRGAWCDMASCGNRVKNRNLRARRRGPRRTPRGDPGRREADRASVSSVRGDHPAHY